MRQKAFSLAELMVALGILTLVLLALAALSASSLGFSEKSDHMAAAHQVAEAQMERIIRNAQADLPLGSRANFWDNDFLAPSSPLDEASIKVGNTEYRYSVFARTLKRGSGQPLGGDLLLKNRLKQVDIVVHWWSEEPGAKTGYGNLSTGATRIVNETAH